MCSSRTRNSFSLSMYIGGCGGGENMHLASKRPEVGSVRRCLVSYKIMRGDGPSSWDGLEKISARMVWEVAKEFCSDHRGKFKWK